MIIQISYKIGNELQNKMNYTGKLTFSSSTLIKTHIFHSMVYDIFDICRVPMILQHDSLLK